MGGISEQTGNYILYGTDCYLTVNGVDLGALIGEVRFEMTTTDYYPDLAQARGPVKGTGKIIEFVGKITATLAEWKFSILASLWSMGASSTADSEKIGSGDVANVTELTNIIITGISRNDLKPVKVTMVYGRVTSPLAAPLLEAEVSGLEVTFEALFDPSAPTKIPMWIEFDA
jgi:hypothetical protein